MNLFKDINKEITQQRLEESTILEMDDVTSLSTSQMDDLVDYVLDMQAQGEKDGGVTDSQELAGQALEDIPGIDTADKQTRFKIVKQIENGVAAKQKKAK